MRRILMFMGIAILAFPLVAVGAVKVRTKVGGYKWDIPAGKRMVKGFKAPVKAGPFTLGFHTQIEMDFESNHQFDFSDETADGQSNNGVAGVNAARGLAVPGDIIKGDEFLSEFRFGMDAVAGPVTTHIVFEAPARSGTEPLRTLSPALSGPGATSTSAGSTCGTAPSSTRSSRRTCSTATMTRCFRSTRTPAISFGESPT